MRDSPWEWEVLLRSKIFVKNWESGCISFWSSWLYHCQNVANIVFISWGNLCERFASCKCLFFFNSDDEIMLVVVTLDLRTRVRLRQVTTPASLFNSFYLGWSLLSLKFRFSCFLICLFFEFNLNLCLCVCLSNTPSSSIQIDYFINWRYKWVLDNCLYKICKSSYHLFCNRKIRNLFLISNI